MDVNVLWKELSAAIERDQWHQAGMLADDLLEWLGKRGFPPKITGKQKLDMVIAKAVAEAVACWEAG